MTPVNGWRVLAVDDESLALAELAFRLRQDERISAVSTVPDGVQTLRLLRTETFDAVFLDVSMPGLDGVELAEILRRMPDGPELVFVTAHESRAAEAYGLDAVDYVLKPVSGARLSEVLRRLERRLTQRGVAVPEHEDDLAVIPVESVGSTRFLLRRDVMLAEAHGDYVRLQTGGRGPAYTWCGSPCPFWKSVGHLRASCASTAAIWSPSRPSPSCGKTRSAGCWHGWTGGTCRSADATFGRSVSFSAQGRDLGEPTRSRHSHEPQHPPQP